MRIVQSANPVFNRSDQVTVREMGNITEVVQILHRSTKAYIRKVDKDHYMLCETGEILECNHIKSRADNTDSVRRSLKKLRDYLNTNVTDIKKCRWVTLTYAENMTDTKRLYSDFKNFILRFNYHCNKQGYGKPEYIVSCEPQGRGAWHCHIIFIFPKNAPFISNDILSSIWSHGYVSIKKIKDDVDNIGAYLSAYLGDMELTELNEIENDFSGKIKAVEIEEDGKKKEKYFVKGARLKYYPPNFNIFRVSRGIKKPIEYQTYNLDAMEKVGFAEPTFQKTISVIDDTAHEINRINYRYYKKYINNKQATTCSD